MQRLLLTPLVLVAVLGVTVAAPAPALAKGASSVTVTGPGVVARSITYTQAPDDVDLDSLAEASGIYGIFGAGDFVARPELSAAELGPRYVLTWYQGPSQVLAVSHVYPFAEGGAWAHVPRGQRLFGESTRAGWSHGGAALERAMVRAGAVEPMDPVKLVEPVKPVEHAAADVRDPATPRADARDVAPVLIISVAVTGLALVAAGWAFARRRAATG